jgi:TRAP-type C4-dicarboxylate transport system substrate-binding protein
MVAALGATATPMPYGEVYSAIETGVIDGAENNFPSYESAKHFEVATNYSLDEHTIVPEVFVISKAAWDKLSDEDKAIFKAAAKESMTKQWELWDARVEASRKIVEDAGSQITTPEKQPFIDAMKPVYDKYVNTPELQDLVARIQATEG